MWSEIAGSSEALLEIAGAHRAQVQRVSGGLDRDVDHEFQAYWVS